MNFAGAFITTKIKDYQGDAAYVLVKDGSVVKLYKRRHGNHSRSDRYQKITLPNNFFFRSSGVQIAYNCGSVSMTQLITDNQDVCYTGSRPVATPIINFEQNEPVPINASGLCTLIYGALVPNDVSQGNSYIDATLTVNDSVAIPWSQIINNCSDTISFNNTENTMIRFDPDIPFTLQITVSLLYKCLTDCNISLDTTTEDIFLIPNIVQQFIPASTTWTAITLNLNCSRYVFDEIAVNLIARLTADATVDIKLMSRQIAVHFI
jgi:hypothetical protein